jgi:uncharacterized membrane protein
MNDAHLHLLLNHFPLIGGLISLLILATGLVIRKDILLNTGLAILLVSAAVTYPVFETGEGAEQIVESMGREKHDVIENAIHEHEEASEKAMTGMMVLGAAAIGTLIVGRKNNVRLRILSIVILVGGIAVMGLMANAAKLGGQISHPEVRDNYMAPAEEGNEENEKG